MIEWEIWYLEEEIILTQNLLNLMAFSKDGMKITIRNILLHFKS